MRQVTSLHRTLVVLAVGLLALAAPLVAYADGGPARVAHDRAPTDSPKRPGAAGLFGCHADMPRHAAAACARPGAAPTAFPLRS